MTKQDRIKQLIAEKGITKAKVSERCGISPITLSKFLSGTAGQLREDKIGRIVEYLEAVNTNEV